MTRAERFTIARAARAAAFYDAARAVRFASQTGRTIEQAALELESLAATVASSSARELAGGNVDVWLAPREGRA